MSTLRVSPRKASLCPVWHVAVELTERDSVKVRNAVVEVAGLCYGNYDGVCFETAAGIQYFRPLSGSQGGEQAETVGLPVRVLTFSIPRDEELLSKVIDAIVDVHSYEEPVIHISEAMATRAATEAGKDNPNRWWNRGFAHYTELGRPGDREKP
ncbi:hypothetical protein [Aestuariivirga sp.]|uniref:hypothetical protein n=1 Tax=Aestuariivirga sp. TaxID=2650926 RepID=UPI00391B021C